MLKEKLGRRNQERKTVNFEIYLYKNTHSLIGYWTLEFYL
jgi:hypothetical protein